MTKAASLVLSNVSHAILRFALTGVALAHCADVQASKGPGDGYVSGQRELSSVSLHSLTRRRATTLRYLEPLARQCPGAGAGIEPSLAVFSVDGLREYARIDIPTTAQPASGFPVVVFLHGWVGLVNAPSWRFGCNPAYVYEQLIDAYVRAGFVVVTPGYRGHGTAGGSPADGVSFLQRWDNASYAIPNFYAADVLSLLAGIRTAGTVPASVNKSAQIDLRRIFLKAHSQGGDVAITVLSALNSAQDRSVIAGASIWAGTFADRVSQAAYYSAMRSSPKAFLSGDGSWTGTARSKNGNVNPDFLFGFPSPQIGIPDPARWTEQKLQWNIPSVEAAYQAGFKSMYAAYGISNIATNSLPFSIRRNRPGRLIVRHDLRLLALVNALEPNWQAAAKTPIVLHFSDRDFFSPPRWNLAFCAKARHHRRQCTTYCYHGNTHELGVSPLRWLSPAGTKAGFDQMLKRDIAFFGLERSRIRRIHITRKTDGEEPQCNSGY